MKRKIHIYSVNLTRNSMKCIYYKLRYIPLTVSYIVYAISYDLLGLPWFVQHNPKSEVFNDCMLNLSFSRGIACFYS